MRPILSTAVLLLALVPAARAGDPDFKAIVRTVESELGIRRMHIPLFGSAMFFVRVARPGGAKQLDMAIFDEAGYSLPNSERFDRIIRNAVGNRWTPLIRVKERHGDELTYIYVRAEKHDLKMILATFEPREAVLIHLKVDPESLRDVFDEPKHAGKTLSGK